jgi:predicted esterase
LTGALIGPADAPRNYSGSLAGTPIFIGGSDMDMHVSKERMLDSAQVLSKLGGQVTTLFYPNMGHEVNLDEIDHVIGLMKQLLK